MNYKEMNFWDYFLFPLYLSLLSTIDLHKTHNKTRKKSTEDYLAVAWKTYRILYYSSNKNHVASISNHIQDYPRLSRLFSPLEGYGVFGYIFVPVKIFSFSVRAPLEFIPRVLGMTALTIYHHVAEDSFTKLGRFLYDRDSTHFSVQDVPILVISAIVVVVVLIPCMVLSLAVRSFTSPREVWRGADALDRKIKLKLVGQLGPIGIAARLTSVVALSAIAATGIGATFSVPILSVMVAPIVATLASAIVGLLAPIVAASVAASVPMVVAASAIVVGVFLSIDLGVKNIFKRLPELPSNTRQRASSIIDEENHDTTVNPAGGVRSRGYKVIKKISSYFFSKTTSVTSSAQSDTDSVTSDSSHQLSGQNVDLSADADLPTNNKIPLGATNNTSSVLSHTDSVTSDSSHQSSGQNIDLPANAASILYNFSCNNENPGSFSGRPLSNSGSSGFFGSRNNSAERQLKLCNTAPARSN